MWLFAAACVEPAPIEPAIVFEPGAVGFGFDGVVLADGTITDFLLGATQYTPILYEAYVSEGFLTGEAGEEETCATWGVFAPPPLDGAALPTDGGALLFHAYDSTVPIERSTCIGRVDPDVWGGEAEALWGPFDGVRIGFGIGPQTPELEAEWSEEDLDLVGSAMLSGWFALEVPGTTGTAPTFVAHAWTTLFAYEVDPVTLDPLITYAESEPPVLVPLDVTALVPGDELPPMYIRSTPLTFQGIATPGG